MDDKNANGINAYLLPYPTEAFSKPVPVGKLEANIGRDAASTIQISNKSISRNHAKIIYKEGCYHLIDMGSSNGTFVNNKPIVQSILNHRDIIAFGKSNFIFMLRADELKDLAVDPYGDSDGDITFNESEIDPSELYAQTAETASFELFNPPVSEQQYVPESYSQALERLTLLYKMSEKFRSFNDIGQVLNETVDLLISAIRNAQQSVIMLKIMPSEPLEVKAYKFRKGKEKIENINLSRTVIHWVISGGMAVYSQDIKEDKRFNEAESVKIYNLNSIICVPIKIKGEVIGAIYIDSGEKLKPMNPGDLAFTAAVSNELALLIENHRLSQERIRNERISAIGMTITDLAHNIKNLVNINLNAVDLMDIHIGEMNKEKIEKNWKFIRRGFEQINNLAVEMLDYAKDNEVKLRPTKINDLVLSTKDFIELDMIYEGIHFELKLDEVNPVWMMDESQLQRAIINLVVNSIDAIDDKQSGRIIIETKVENNQKLTISVADNGHGIDSNQIDKVYYLFYTTKGTGGSGLGLPVVKKFVESLNGKVIIDSTVGSGTTVSMVFPKNPEPI